MQALRTRLQQAIQGWTSPHSRWDEMTDVPRGSTRVFALMDLAAYVTVAGGYLLAVLTAQSQITLPGFAILTAANLCWLWLYRRIDMVCTSEPQRLRHFAGIIALTVTVEMLPLIGVGFDWLLPLVVVGMVGMQYAWRRGLMLSGVMYALTIMVFLVIDRFNARDIFSSLVSITPAFAFVFVFSLVARHQMEQRERAEALVAQLEAAQSKLQQYAREVEDLSAARERNRIAREIHDTLGHYLTILAVQLETATKLEERGDARLHAELVEARRVAAECLREVRHSVSALRPSDPTATSFADALARLAAEFEAVAPDTEVVLDLEGSAQELAAEMRVTLYRCVQESLTNIRKHTRATKVLVRLRIDIGGVELTVLDNGGGEAAQTASREAGFGLVGMRERIALLGGTVTAGPDAGRGWRVAVHMPLTAQSKTTGDTAQEAGPPVGSKVEEQVA